MILHDLYSILNCASYEYVVEVLKDWIAIRKLTIIITIFIEDTYFTKSALQKDPPTKITNNKTNTRRGSHGDDNENVTKQ